MNLETFGRGSGTRTRNSARRLVRSAVAAACLTGVLVVVEPIVSTPAGADPAAGPGVFSSAAPGAISAGVVPDGTCAARVTALGGAGASSAATGGAAVGGRGSAGANVNATFSVLPQQAVSGSIGGGGAVALTGGVGGGGAGANAPSNHDGAGGGGRSVLAIAGTTLVVAGGGGGAGAAHNATPAGDGGAAGFSLTGAGVAVGSNGSDGVDGPAVSGGGRGGQAAAGGAGGVNTGAAARNGFPGGGTATGTGGAGGVELGFDGAGGGGAGYTGGGGGASTTTDTVTGGGGGGGSSFVASASPVVTGPAPTAVTGSAGVRPVLGAAGANGSLSVDWVPCVYDLALTKTPSATSVNAGGKITWTISVTNNGPDPMTRGDLVTLTDTLPSGSNATSPSPNNVVTSIGVSGGSNTNMTSGAFTCTGLSVGSAMPSSASCSRAYAGAAGTPGTPSGGTRGLNVGETLTVVYEQIISNTAACGTITDTATVVDRPTVNTSVATNHTGNTVTDTASGTVTINCYDLAITKTASPTPGVVQGGTVTWNVTVVNDGPGNMVGPHATSANPLIITDSFPSSGVGAPTLVSQTGSAGTCTFASPTITCPGSLNAGQQHSLTFTQSVSAAATVASTISNTASVSDPRTGDSNDSSTATTQVVAAPRIVLQKTLGGQVRFHDSDQFLMSIAGAGGGTATTSGTGSTIASGTVTVATGTPGATYTLSEAMAPGSVATLGQYAGSIACTNAHGGSSTVLPAGSGTSFTITPQATDNITCTFSNTPRPAQVRVAVTTLGGVGTFDFAATNLATASTSVTTTATATPAASAAVSVTTASAAVQLTETVPSGWRLTGVACSDANSAVTGNNGSFGTVVNNVITIPAAFVEPAADITCTFTNEKLARLVIEKTANGGPGTFGYTSTGGLTPSAFDLSPNPPATPTASRTFADLVPGSYSVTESTNPLFQLTDLSCVAASTSAPGSTLGTDLVTRTVTATLVAGADYTCSYTNVRDAQMTVVSTSVGGDATFSYTTTGSGQSTDPAPSNSTASGVASSSFAVPFLSGVASRTLTITQSTPPPGWVLRSVVCTDSGGAPVGTVVLPSVTVTLTPVDTVSCNFTNDRLARVTIVEQSIGTTAAFGFTGGTNGLPASFSLDTSATNPASSMVFELPAFGTATSITQTVPANYTLTSVTCVDGSGTTVSSALVGSRLTIDPAAIVGGADLTCRFVNTRQSAEVRIDKAWFGAAINDRVTISSSGATNNPGLVSVADTSSETDAGTARTVFAGETLTFAEGFDVGTAASYTSMLSCIGAADTNAGNGLAISPADDGATIVCQYANSRLPNATKTAGSVTGPSAAGVYTANYTVAVANPGSAGTYGALVDSPSFASNIEVTGASWTAVATAGAAPAGGSATGAGPFTLAPVAQAIAAGTTHTYDVNVRFRFTTYTAASACSTPGTGLYNSITLATSELQTADNSACIAPPAPPAPAIDIDKTATPVAVGAAGATVAYSFAVANTGDVDLTAVSVSDPLPGLGAITCPATTLARGTSMTCTATYTVTQNDVDSGAINNLASARGSAPNASEVSDSDTHIVTATRSPAMSLLKTASPTSVTTSGQIITYSFLVANTGNVTLSSVGVGDPLAGLGAINCPANTLAPGMSTTCTASYTATQSDVDAGTILNTATAAGTPPAGAGAPVTAVSSASVTAARTPSITTAKTADPATIASAGQVVHYSFLVKNTGNVTLASVGVADPLPGLGPVTCPATVLAPAATTVCTADYTATQADINAGTIVNTATATATPPTGAGGPVSDTDLNTVTVTRSPAIDLQKTASPTNVAHAGDVVTYSFVVTNNGNVTLHGVSVADPKPGLSAVSCPSTSLAPTASITCTATYTVTQSDLDRGTIDNAATVHGSPLSGSAVSDAASSSVTATRAPQMSLVKSASPGTIAGVGEVVTYSFLVTNTGNVTLASVAVGDALPNLSTVSCPASTLAPAASTTCTATYTATQADIDRGVIDNTATVTGSPVGGGASISDSDSESVSTRRTPNIRIVKTASPTTVTAAGQTVSYSFALTNSGNVTLTSVGVVDPLPGLGAITCGAAMLAPGASTSCSAIYTVTQDDVDAGTIVNTASVLGTPPPGAGAPVSDDDAATVTATRSPATRVVKTATPNNVTAAGQTVDYSFLVTNTGNVRLTSVGITDVLPGLGRVTCPVTTLAPGGSTTCHARYVATQADVDHGAIENTATVRATPPPGAGGPVSDTDSETVSASAAPVIQIVKSASRTTVTAAGQAITYSFEVLNTGNTTLRGVTVVDPLPGLGAISCPTATLAPGATMTCTAGYSVSQADMDAGNIASPATATGTPPSGPAVVDTDRVSVTATQGPQVALVKSADPSSVDRAGRSITYSFVVTNTGNVTLTDLVIDDALPGVSTVSCPVTTLAPASSTTCTATKVATQSDIDAGAIINTATVSGTPPTGPAVTASDSRVVDAPARGSIELVKTATPTTVTAAGQIVAFSFALANTGNVTLTGVAVGDPLPGLSAVSCLRTALAPGDTTTCTASYTVTIADMDSGSIVNTATAVGVSPAGAAVHDDDTATVAITQSPAVELQKTATPNNVTAVGQTIQYRFAITNRGNVTLSSVSITDPRPGLGAVSCPTTTLAPGTSTTCTASLVVTQDDLDAGTIPNTATVTATPPNGPAITDTDSTTVTATTAAAIQLVKTPTPSTVTTVGEIVSYALAVTNTGGATLRNIAVTDPMPGLTPVLCPVNSLAPGASTTCTATYTVTQSDLDAGVITNTASASGRPSVGATIADNDTATVAARPTHGIALSKTASPSTVAAAGAVVTYTFGITNTGASTLTHVVVDDTLPGLSAISCPAARLAPKARLECSATYVVTQADADAGSVVNNATVAATPGAGTPVTATSSAKVIVTAAPAISLVKSVTPATAAKVGDTVTFGFAVANTGNVTLAGVVVRDPMPGLSVITCPGFAGTLAPGASTSCTATYRVTQADVNAGAIHNVATVSGAAGTTGVAVTGRSSIAVAVSQTPSLTLVKTVSMPLVASGTTVVYTFVVTNTGNVAVDDIEVSDPLPGLSVITCGGFNGTLQPGESVTCSASYVAELSAATEGRIETTARVSGRSPGGTALSSQDSVPVAVADLILPKTGSTVAPVLTFAATLVLLGWVTVTLGRRRRRTCA